MINIKLFLLFLILPSIALSQGNNYSIKGTVKNYFPGQKIYFIPLNANERRVDSVIITNGDFMFSGLVNTNIPAEDLYLNSVGNLFLAHNNRGINFNLFVLDGKQEVKDMKPVHVLPGLTEINIIDSVHDAKIKTSASNQAYYVVDSISGSFYKKWSILVSEVAKKTGITTEDRLNQMDSQSDIFKQEETQAKWKFVKDHPSSAVSLFLLKYDFDNNKNPQYSELAPLYFGLSKELKETAVGKKYGLMLNELRKLNIGAMAPNFTLNDVNGTPISLSSFKGKYVLVDFWAPWSIDSRVENSNVVIVYNNFKNYNFTVVGVSLSEKRSDWLDYIRIDKLPWMEISDLKGLDGEAAKLYAINALPQNILVDPKGKIIAKNLFGNHLAKKLTQLFKN